ncbi:MAG: glutamine-hydrolyzing GMP synthase [Methermicoccaceae archaeon]
MVKVDRFIEKATQSLKEQIDGKALLALSGGVDSSVCLMLARRAIGELLVPVYIDTGLMREGETERIVQLFGDAGLKVVYAEKRFLDGLKGITDPEEKRKAFGGVYLKVLEDVALEEQVEYLIQGTIYPDFIESLGGIKSHHNVKGLPDVYAFRSIVEPIKELYKDEVREVARALGLPSEICERMPFPGPGLSVRILGEVTREKVEIARCANKIVEEELLEQFKPWQTYAALVGMGTGVKGDVRAYGWIVAVRAVESRDGMTAQALHIPHEALTRLASRLTGEIPEVTHVMYDLSSKPPATIELE